MKYQGYRKNAESIRLLASPSSEREEMSSPYAANIAKYYLYTVLYGFAFGLIIAIWVIYLQQRRGLNLTQVGITDAAFWITAALCEVPTGAVADVAGRKISIALGLALISVSLFVWGLASTVLLLIVAYAVMAVGFTFLSGAQDAFLFESLSITGRASEYTRTAGRVQALTFGATAVGSVASGLLATIDLVIPIFASSGLFLVAFGLVLTFKEPASGEERGKRSWKRYGEVVRDSITMIRARATLRYALSYLTAVAAIAYIMSGYFLQPQALLLGVPVAAIGAVVTAVQGARIVGSLIAHGIGDRLGERVTLYSMPILVIVMLVALALLQLLPALLLIAAIGFLIAALNPLVMNIIQKEVTDEVRATVLSMQSVMFSALIVVSEPALGYAADQSGLPAAYLVLAGSLGIFLLFLLWKGRDAFPKKSAPANQISAVLE